MDAPTQLECDLLLRGGSVITVDDERAVLEPGAVAIAGERIVAVGPPEELSGYRAARTVDCTDKAVMPGLIDCHNHVFMSLTRSLGEGMSLHPWLRAFIWPWSFALKPEEAQLGQRLSAIEAIRAGTTSILDNYYGPRDVHGTLAVAEAMDEVGVRGVVTRSITGQPTDVATQMGMFEAFFEFSPEKELQITAQCMEARPPGRRVSIWPAPLNLLYVDHSLLLDSVALARDRGARWHTHCSETRRDPERFVEHFGVRPVEWLMAEGILDSTTTLAHAVWLDDREIQLLAETGANLAHNPISNQYLASGVMRLRELRNAGAVVGLGTDGAACGHRQDMFDCMKSAVLLQRVRSLDPEAAFAEDALEMATRDGARYLGIDGGVLAPGKLADVIVVDLDRPHLVPDQRTVATLVYAARGSDVAMTIVGGEVVYEEGACTKVDERAVMEEAKVRANEIIERADLHHLTVPWRARA